MRWRVTYTDLDIYWHATPCEEIVSDLSDNVWIQYTPRKIRSEWFCTGVMSWSNCTNNKDALQKLINVQNESRKSGISSNDEIIFNKYYDTLGIVINKLSTKKYLIGKEFNKIILAYPIFFPSLKCYHSNYIVGNYQKAKILEVIESRLSSKFYWLRFFPGIISYNLQNLITRVKNRLREIK